MKRYRISKFSIDSTRNILRDTNKRGNLAIMKAHQMEYILSDYGSSNSEEKFARYIELEKPVLSIVDEHTHILRDICDSYVLGSYYSSLTGACCLGERIFNNIIFKVMDDFKSSEYYKEVYNKSSIIDWEKAIKILSSWKIIDDETEKKYRRLYKLRTESVHFQKKEQDAKDMALEAINAINFIVEGLFGLGERRKSVLIYFEVPGELFIKKEAEINPMVKAFYIPCSILVGPNCTTRAGKQPGSIEIIDIKYDDKEISDAEFVKLRNGHKSA